MSIIREFNLFHFPNGDENLLLDGAPIVPNSLVLFIQTVLNGEPSGLSPLCYVPEDLESDTLYFYKEYEEVGSYRVVVAYGTSSPMSVFFEYTPEDISSTVFNVDNSAMSFIGSVSFPSSGGGTETPSNGVFLESLNGADGSFADGTPVTVVSRDGSYKVLASRNYYNDAKEKQNMLFYLLERTDLSHKPTMLVADVHVQKVA